MKGLKAHDSEQIQNTESRSATNDSTDLFHYIIEEVTNCIHLTDSPKRKPSRSCNEDAGFTHSILGAGFSRRWVCSCREDDNEVVQSIGWDNAVLDCREGKRKVPQAFVERSGHILTMCS